MRKKHTFFTIKFIVLVTILFSHAARADNSAVFTMKDGNPNWGVASSSLQIPNKPQIEYRDRKTDYHCVYANTKNNATGRSTEYPRNCSSNWRSEFANTSHDRYRLRRTGHWNATEWRRYGQ